MALNPFSDKIRALWEKKETWPPTPEIKKHWEEIDTYRLRYDNDRGKMIMANPNISIDQHKIDIFIPVPWPRELCRFSAALLFSETPKVTSGPHKELVADLERVNDFGAFAMRGGVKVAKDGRIGIRVIRDPDISEFPLLTLVEEDRIIWDERHGAFYVGGMVVLTRRPDPQNDPKAVWRLLEGHTTGLVTRHLYRGTETELGKEKSLKSLSEFENLMPEEHTGLNAPTLIPWENVPGAESDLFGLGSIFDVLSEAESLLLDRARKAVPRVFVDRSLADSTGRIEIDGYILSGGARMRPALGTSPGELINVVEPKFDAAAHIQWNDHLAQLLVTCAGYSPLTWGIQGHTATVQRAVSGYAMKLSQLRTLLNRSAKEHMALQAMAWGFATAIAMHEDTFDVAACLPGIELGDGLPSDPLDGAQEVLYLRQAMAASTQELVKTVHPTWTPEEIAVEVDAIVEQAAFPPASGQAQGVGPLGPQVKSLLGRKDAAGDGVDPDAP